LNKRSKATLTATIRLVPDVDAIGIPVFTVPDSNMMFVPETDGELRIVRFLDFFNEEGYALTFDLPPSFYRKWYSLGDPGPLPFWIDGRCHVLEGNAERTAPRALVSSLQAGNQVVADMSRILGSARDGLYKKRAAAWKAEEIAASFGDVLYEQPVHSTYWVSRYRLAVTTARELTQPPHPIDRKLRSKARDWLSRFGSKTDLKRLRGLLGRAEDAIFDAVEIQDVLFAYFTHKIATGSALQVQKEALQADFLDLFPSGLYGHYVEQGWPKVPYVYQKPRPDFLARMRNEIYESNRLQDFSRARQLSILLFGTARLPADISDLLQQFMRPRFHEFNQQLNWAFGSFFRERSNARSWADTAHDLLVQHTQLIELDSIEHGDARSNPVFVENHFGVTLDLYNRLRQYAGLHTIKTSSHWKPTRQ
jgi:hypothetical protein